MEDIEEKEHMRQLLSTKLADMNLSKRLLDFTQSHNIYTLGELSLCSKKILTQYGMRGYSEITDLLDSLGLLYDSKSITKDNIDYIRNTNFENLYGFEAFAPLKEIGITNIAELFDKYANNKEQLLQFCKEQDIFTSIGSILLIQNNLTREQKSEIQNFIDIEVLRHENEKREAEAKEQAEVERIIAEVNKEFEEAYPNIDGCRFYDDSTLYTYADQTMQSYAVPDRVVEISKSAFVNHPSLEEIKLHDHLSTIGEKAFKACKVLRSVVIPDSVKTIGDCVFQECQSLYSVKWPEGLTIIPKHTFRDCKSLHDVVLPKGVEILEYSSFRDCEGLESLDLPSSLKEIRRYAFCGCKSLRNISFPQSIRFIGKGAFEGCESLEKVSIPYSKKLVIEDGAFCPNTQVELVKDSRNWLRRILGNN